jgi:hypothetical protein
MRLKVTTKPPFEIVTRFTSRDFNRIMQANEPDPSIDMGLQRLEISNDRMPDSSISIHDDSCTTIEDGPILRPTSRDHLSGYLWIQALNRVSQYPTTRKMLVRAIAVTGLSCQEHHSQFLSGRSVTAATSEHKENKSEPY